jgi:hypothetical protein
VSRREVRAWRRLAVAVAGAVALLTVRVLASRDIPVARRVEGLWGGLADEDDLFSETGAQQAERRLGACETHLADLEERLNEKAPMEVINSMAGRVSDLEARDA